MDVIFKNANFWIDAQGVLIFTDIEKEGEVSKAEVIYDGKNAVVLNRNDKDFYALKNIAPRYRQKISDAKSVIIVEKDKNGIYSYEVVVRNVKDLGIADDWDQYASSVMSELKGKLSPEILSRLTKEAEHFLDDVENA